MRREVRNDPLGPIVSRTRQAGRCALIVLAYNVHVQSKSTNLLLRLFAAWVSLDKGGGAAMSAGKEVCISPTLWCPHPAPPLPLGGMTAFMKVLTATVHRRLSSTCCLIPSNCSCSNNKPRRKKRRWMRRRTAMPCCCSRLCNTTIQAVASPPVRQARSRLQSWRGDSKVHVSVFAGNYPCIHMHSIPLSDHAAIPMLQSHF